MLSIGECKDEAVRKDLTNYGKCVTKLFPDVVQKVMALRVQYKTDIDACFTQVMAVIGDYQKTNPDASAKAEDCFHSNVKTEDLKNCH